MGEDKTDLEDGTLRKSPHLWREWSSKLSLELHPDQLAVALRAARLLRVGGRMVYSCLAEWWVVGKLTWLGVKHITYAFSKHTIAGTHTVAGTVS